ncbi:putative protein FAM90A10P [Plecturocebus cupreus]
MELFFFHFFFFDIFECYMLTSMACDCSVTICYPLLYNTAMSPKVCFSLMLSSYFLSFSGTMAHTGCTLRLTFCDANIISHNFCDILPVFQLSCTRTYINELVVFIVAAININVPVNHRQGAVAHTPQSSFQRRGPQPLLLVKPTNSHPEGGCHEVSQAASSTHGLKQVVDPHAQAKRPAVTSQPCPPAATHSLGLGSHLSFRPGDKRPAQALIQACLSFPKKARLDPIQIPEESTHGGELGALETLQPLPALTELQPSTSPQVSRRTPAQVPSMDLQPPQSRPRLPTAQAYSMSHHPAASQDGDQPLRKLFRRLEDGVWSSRFLMVPSSHSLEEPGDFPTQSPPRILEKSEGPCVCVPRSVLCEDLQVSSSSEEELD